MDVNLDRLLKAGLLVVAGIATATFLAGCGGGSERKAAAPATANPSNHAAATSSTAVTDGTGPPRHRVGETDAERSAIIEPWRTCMKDHGADLDTMPPNIKEAERWSAEHQGAANACGHLLPLLPWGLDPANPERRNNIHQWVKCMNDQGLPTVETPDDDEAPWRYGGSSPLSPADRDKVELDCEKETIDKSDR
jgi:hypothetical protein